MSPEPVVLGVIAARSGSKGLPQKNIRPLLGKPLIQWSVEQAIECAEITRVVVSTDSAQIAEIACSAGAEVPFVRPASLSGDKVGKFQVWKHALEQCEAVYKESYDCLVDLDCTSPLRDVDDISAAISQFRELRLEGVDAVFSVCEARKNPYFNLVERDVDGALRISKKTSTGVLSRQAAPQVYDHVASIYVLDPPFVRSSQHLLDGHAEGYHIDPKKRFDVDDELDFRIVEMLMSDRIKEG